MYFDKSIGVSRRRLIPVENIKNICWGRQNYDDELRWLIAVISDKGMRLAEAAGLLKSDLEIENDAPHVELKPHPWRPLKTPRSTRLIIQLGRLRGSQKHLRVVLLYIIYYFVNYPIELIISLVPPFGRIDKGFGH